MELVLGALVGDSYPGALVGDSYLGTLPSLLPKLAELLKDEYNLQKEERGGIRFLQAELESMQAALEHISKIPPEQLSGQDKIWPWNVRQLSYDIEDSIDTIMMQAEQASEPAKKHGLKKLIDKTLDALMQPKIRRMLAVTREPSPLDWLLLPSITEKFSERKRIGHGGRGDVYKAAELNLLERILAGTEEPKHLDLSLLQSITEKFSETKRIGHGGCGEVYKGILRNGTVAVKRLFKSHTIKDKMFHREVTSLVTARHENIVRFLGYCSVTVEHAIPYQGETIMAEIRERLLCFEFINNGSLDNHLKEELSGLEWQTRYEIIVGICKGLLYLHEEKQIIHMDLKPANILLDDCMVPKIADFGLSRFDKKSQAGTTSRLMSEGYCAPEYRSYGKSSKKSDIYSLGVMITELVTGSISNPNVTKVLRRWRHRWIKSSKHTPLGYQQVMKCLELARRCRQIDPADRPDIPDIIHELNTIDTNENQSPVTPCLLEDILGIEPLEIHIPFELDEQISHSIELINDTDDHIAFMTKVRLDYLDTEPDKGIVQPRSKCSVTIIVHTQVNALPNGQHKKITILSSRVDGGLAPMDVTKDMFIDKEGKVVDEVNVTVISGKSPLEEDS